jgi:hypothetical protein
MKNTIKISLLAGILALSPIFNKNYETNAGLKEFFESITPDDIIRQEKLKDYVKDFWEKRAHPKKTIYANDKGGVLRKCKRKQYPETFWYRFNNESTRAIVSGFYYYEDDFERTLKSYDFEEEYKCDHSWKYIGLNKDEEQASTLEEGIKKLMDKLK